MTNPLPPVPRDSITQNTQLTPQWLSWFNQLYVYVTAGQQGGGGLVPGTTEISTTAPIKGGGAITSDLNISLEQDGVTNDFLSPMAGFTVKGNPGPTEGQPQDMNPGQLKPLLDLKFTDISGVAELDQIPQIPFSDLSGSLETGQYPQMPADTMIGNNQGVEGTGENLTVAQIQALLSIITTQPQLGNLLYPQTPAESAAGVSPASPWYPYGNALRYGVDPTGTVDTTNAIQNWVNATWAMYHFQDDQGLWNGGGGAAPVMTLPPGKYMISNTITLPTGITFKGTGHPANTVSHTRIILNSTGTSPGRLWSSGTVIPTSSSINPSTGFGTYYFTATTGGTTGSPSPPNWLSAQSPGATLVDGSVVWTAQAPMGPGDNRNNPMFRFARGTLPPSLGNGMLQNSACTTTIQELEFWTVTLGVSTFSNPLAGIGLSLGDYPNGGIFNFEVDAADFRFKDCVFQHSAAAIRSFNVNLNTSTRPDGFPGNRGLGIFFENCEFDASAAHFYIQNCWLDFYIEDCEFFGGIHRFEGCTGNLRYQGGDMFGGAYVDAVTVSNSLTMLIVKGVTIEPVSTFPQIGLDLQSGLSAGVVTRFVDISENTFVGAATRGGIYVTCANCGRISDNSLDSQGFNAPVGTDTSNFIAAINVGGCQNLSIAGNNITASNTSGAFYNGFGILTWTLGSSTSQKNFVNNNSVTAPYNAAAFNGQDRLINLATGDIRGLNYDSSTSATIASVGQMNTQQITLQGATPAGATGQLCFGTSLNTAATPGSVASPGNYVGYLTVSINGAFCNIPYYN